MNHKLVKKENPTSWGKQIYDKWGGNPPTTLVVGVVRALLWVVVLGKVLPQFFDYYLYIK